MTDDQLLIHRVLNAVPARSYAMNALLSLLRVEASREVPTAAISCERRPVLRVNPDFVREHCRTDEHLFLLVMHELYHVLLGHTRLFPRATPAHNVAFDAVINSLLALQLPERAYTSFFLDYYGGERGPLRLLAPPAPPPIASEALAALHRLLYSDGKTTSEEIFEAIVRSGLEPGDGRALLGSHGAAGGRAPGEAGEPGDWGTGGAVDPAFVEALRAIVEKWPPPRVSVSGRSLASQLGPSRWLVSPSGSQTLAAVRRALLGAATRSAAAPRRAWGPVPAQVVLPDLRDRRSTVLRASTGRPPLLYDSSLPSPRGRDEGHARVYLDVSGSMDRLPRAPLRSAVGTSAAHPAGGRSVLHQGRDDPAGRPRPRAASHDRRDRWPLRASRTRSAAGTIGRSS